LATKKGDEGFKNRNKIKPNQRRGGIHLEILTIFIAMAAVVIVHSPQAAATIVGLNATEPLLADLV
jgi:hypothetical protein